MKPYPKYKDSGLEWIGEVPEGWSTVMIKRLSPVKRGASPRPIHDPKYFDIDGEFAWVRIADVSASERYLEATTQTLSELGASLSVKRFPGDFFLSIAGTVGKPIITKIKCCIHDGFVYFPQLEISPEFLYYIFSTGLPYQGLGKWGTQLNLNTDTVGEIFIPIPKDEEKDLRKIINYLDRKTAEIDGLIAGKERLIELYEEEKTAVINQAVTKGLDPEAPMKPSGIDWLGDIPAHWEVKALKYALDFHDSRRIPLSSEVRGKMLVKEYDYYGASGIIDQVEDYIFDGEYILLGEDGANLLTRSTGLAFKAVGKFWVNNHAHILTPKDGNIDYFVNLLENIDYTIWVSGSAQPKLTAEALGNVKIAFPDPDEQIIILKHIETQCSRLDAIIDKFKKQIELLKEYRTTLISEVVTGKIDVRDEVLQ